MRNRRVWALAMAVLGFATLAQAVWAAMPSRIR